jgi:GDP-mannose 6-dehydrogenase
VVLGTQFSLFGRAHDQAIDLIGLGIKANTDDLRESPFVELAEPLPGQGYELKINDRGDSLEQSTGSNNELIDKVILHLSRLMVSSLEEFVECELQVIGHHSPNVREFLHNVDVPLRALG